MDVLKKQVLTIINGSEVKNFLAIALKILKTDEGKIKEIVDQLVKEKYISIIELGNKKKIYSHTSKVRKEMLDEDLHYKYGSRPLHTYP